VVGAIGEIRTVERDDGSTVYLGSGSALDTNFGPDRRRLDLSQGEAWFEVAPDPSRPFVVRAGDGTATALGTVYDVKHVNGRVQVTVIEGRVEVDYRSPGSPNRKIVLAAGQQTTYRDDSVPRGSRPGRSRCRFRLASRSAGLREQAARRGDRRTQPLPSGLDPHRRPNP
jgi:transmembrane sensor